MMRNVPSVGTMRRDLNVEYFAAHVRAAVLEVLIDPAGGGFCNYPSGDPTPKACSLADAIVQRLIDMGR